jgi:hypothetical protein
MNSQEMLEQSKKEKEEYYKFAMEKEIDKYKNAISKETARTLNRHKMLLKAISFGSVELVKKLLKEDADLVKYFVLAPDRPPLLWSVCKGKLSTYIYLKETYGIDRYAQNTEELAVRVAIWLDNFEITEWIIKNSNIDRDELLDFVTDKEEKTGFVMGRKEIQEMFDG